jgi:hypothetical protein
MAAIAVDDGISGANESEAVGLPVDVRLCHRFWLGGGARATFDRPGISDRAGSTAMVDDRAHSHARERTGCEGGSDSWPLPWPSPERRHRPVPLTPSPIRSLDAGMCRASWAARS